MVVAGMRENRSGNRLPLPVRAGDDVLRRIGRIDDAERDRDIRPSDIPVERAEIYSNRPIFAEQVLVVGVVELGRVRAMQQVCVREQHAAIVRRCGVRNVKLDVARQSVDDLTTDIDPSYGDRREIICRCNADATSGTWDRDGDRVAVRYLIASRTAGRQYDDVAGRRKTVD